MKISWTRSTRKHRIGRAHALHVIGSVTPSPHVSKQGEPALLYIGPDDRGVELEIVVVIQPDRLLVIHVMPTALRRGYG